MGIPWTNHSHFSCGKRYWCKRRPQSLVLYISLQYIFHGRMVIWHFQLCWIFSFIGKLVIKVIRIAPDLTANHLKSGWKTYTGQQSARLWALWLFIVYKSIISDRTGKCNIKCHLSWICKRDMIGVTLQGHAVIIRWF